MQWMQFDKYYSWFPYHGYETKESKWQTAISNSFKNFKKKINLNQISSFFVGPFRGGDYILPKRLYKRIAKIC